MSFHKKLLLNDLPCAAKAAEHCRQVWRKAQRPDPGKDWVWVLVETLQLSTPGSTGSLKHEHEFCYRYIQWAKISLHPSLVSTPRLVCLGMQLTQLKHFWPGNPPCNNPAMPVPLYKRESLGKRKAEHCLSIKISFHWEIESTLKPSVLRSACLFNKFQSCKETKSFY